MFSALSAAHVCSYSPCENTRTRAHACRGIDGVGVGICTSEGESFKCELTWVLALPVPFRLVISEI